MERIYLEAIANTDARTAQEVKVIVLLFPGCTSSRHSGLVCVCLADAIAVGML
jgi:hypothetical protein